MADDPAPAGDPLEHLSSPELHDLAVGRARRHLDAGFFWRLLQYMPAAEATAGEWEESERDTQSLIARFDDVSDAGKGEVAEALRPYFLEYLREHGVTP
jgi:hypothetical protein